MKNIPIVAVKERVEMLPTMTCVLISATEDASAAQGLLEMTQETAWKQKLVKTTFTPSSLATMKITENLPK